jgi:hypothetical protein
MSGQLKAPAALPPKERGTSIQGIRCWVDPKPGLHAAEERNVYLKMFSIRSAIRKRNYTQPTPNYTKFDIN